MQYSEYHSSKSRSKFNAKGTEHVHSLWNDTSKNSRRKKQQQKKQKKKQLVKRTYFFFFDLTTIIISFIYSFHWGIHPGNKSLLLMVGITMERSLIVTNSPVHISPSLFSLSLSLSLFLGGIKMKAKIIFLLLILCTCKWCDASQQTNTDQVVNVYASRIGTTIGNSVDFFKTTRAEPHEARAEYGVLMTQNMAVVLSCPLTSKGTIHEHYSVQITDIEFKEWSNILKDNFYSEFNILGRWLYLPLGRTGNGKTEVFLHRKILFTMKNGKIIDVSASAETIKFSNNLKLTFTYSCEAVDVTKKRYIDSFTNESQNLLLGDVMLRILLRCSTTSKTPIEDEDSIFASIFVRSGAGWKLLASEVFRKTNSGTFLCALGGVGVHCVCFIILWDGVAHDKWYSCDKYTAVLLFQMCYGAGGFASGYFFMGNGLQPQKKRMWLKCLFVNYFAVTSPLLLIHITNLFQLLVIGELNGNNLKSISLTLISYMLIGFPLLFAGTLLGRHFSSGAVEKTSPHANQVPRIVPSPSNKLLRPKIMFIVSGVVPYAVMFGSYNTYLKVMFLLQPSVPSTHPALPTFFFFFVTVCQSLIGTFTLLNAENHRWKWISFGLGCACSVYFLAHSVVFYIISIGSFNVFVFQLYMIYSAGFIFFATGRTGKLHETCSQTPTNRRNKVLPFLLLLRKYLITLKSQQPQKPSCMSLVFALWTSSTTCCTLKVQMHYGTSCGITEDKLYARFPIPFATEKLSIRINSTRLFATDGLGSNEKDVNEEVVKSSSRLKLSLELDTFGCKSFPPNSDTPSNSHTHRYNLQSKPFQPRSDYVVAYLDSNGFHITPVSTIQQFTPLLDDGCSSATLSHLGDDSTPVSQPNPGQVNAKPQREFLKQRSDMLGKDAMTAKEIHVCGLNSEESISLRHQLSSLTLETANVNIPHISKEQIENSLFPPEVYCGKGDHSTIVRRFASHYSVEQRVRVDEPFTTEKEVVTILLKLSFFMHGVWVSFNCPQFKGLGDSLRGIVLAHFFFSEDGRIARTELNSLFPVAEHRRYIKEILETVAALNTEEVDPSKRRWKLNRAPGAAMAQAEWQKICSYLPTEMPKQQESWKLALSRSNALAAMVNAGKTPSLFGGMNTGDAGRRHDNPARTDTVDLITHTLRNIFLKNGVLTKEALKSKLLEERRVKYPTATPQMMQLAIQSNVQQLTNTTWVLKVPIIINTIVSLNSFTSSQLMEALSKRLPNNTIPENVVKQVTMEVTTFKGEQIYVVKTGVGS
eukprot:gene84-57_t